MIESSTDPLSHPSPAEVRLACVLKAVADPTRLEIVRRLARAEPGELTCGDFGCATKQLATHHLRTLREAGVTITREEGRNRYVRLAREVLEEVFPGFLNALIASAHADERRERSFSRFHTPRRPN